MSIWRNYWTVAVRALAKSKTYSIINIAGLAIGMAACILILLYIRYEQSYDKWLPDAENTYQFQTFATNPDDGEEFFMQMASYVTRDRLEKDFPQIENAAYLLGTGPVFLKDGQASSTEDYKYTDEDFLKVVNLPLVAGTTLNAAQTAVLTESEAKLRFGTTDVVGRTIERNTCTNDWYYDLDLTLSQELPGPARLFGIANAQDRIRLYAMFDNFLNLLDDGWNLQHRRNFSGLQDVASLGGVDSEGRYIITAFNGVADFENDNFINVSSSVWRIKVGVSYEF